MNRHQDDNNLTARKSQTTPGTRVEGQKASLKKRPSEAWRPTHNPADLNMTT